MKRYAFIDVQNTETTTLKVLKFAIDHERLFAYLEKVTVQGAKVAIVSSAKKVQKGPRYSISRLSTKLRKLTQASGAPVRFIEIDNLKFQIKKEA
ncbi:hypothetical protein HZC00_05700 [Candidatus Kaiserbacteria bacterium]|nr:hypothetical protein [Candidatus Kaiserbacteria bacterium]